MDIISGISAATEAIKLTKELREIDREIDKAELKLRLVDLTDQLLSAKEALQDARERERQLLNEIVELKKTIEFSRALEDEKGCLYELDENGARKGQPYCNLCYVREEKLYRLKYHPRSDFGASGFWCDNCKTKHYE